MTYKKATLEIVEFSVEDIIVTSAADITPNLNDGNVIDGREVTEDR